MTNCLWLLTSLWSRASRGNNALRDNFNVCWFYWQRFYLFFSKNPSGCHSYGDLTCDEVRREDSNCRYFTTQFKSFHLLASDTRRRRCRSKIFSLIFYSNFMFLKRRWNLVNMKLGSSSRMLVCVSECVNGVW
jgi:hypothetical protein